MNSLQGLRLNCWLAGVLPAVVAAGALLVIGNWVAQAYFETVADGARRALQAHVVAAQPSAEALMAADHQWLGGQRVLIDAADDLTVAETHGSLLLQVADPHPNLYLSVTAPRSWYLAPDRLAVATPVVDSEGAFLWIFYAELAVRPPRSNTWLALAASLVLVLGAAMAWYLGRRVYRPVDELCLQAEAALQGRHRPLSGGTMETKALATAVSALAEAFVERRAEETQIAGQTQATVLPPAPAPAPAPAPETDRGPQS